MTVIVGWPGGLYPTSGGFKTIGRTARYPSPITAGEVSQELQGGRWGADMAFGPLESDEWHPLDGLVASMISDAAYVDLPWFHYTYRGRMGGVTGSLFATGAARAKSVTITGVTGTAPHFKAGDVFTILHRLYRVRADTTATSGTASVPIWPPLRSALGSNTVEYVNPTCVMRLLDDTQGEGQFEAPANGSYRISFIEPLP